MSGHLGIGFPILNLLLVKILIALNFLSVALASLPSHNITITPEIALQGQNLGVYGAIYRYFEPDKVETALKIALAESRLDPKAKNASSSASGIFQIIKGTWKAYSCSGDPFNHIDNIKCAALIAEDGWGAWKSSGNWK